MPRLLIHPRLGWLAGECIDREPSGYLQHQALQIKKVAHEIEAQRDAYCDAMVLLVGALEAIRDKADDENVALVAKTARRDAQALVAERLSASE